MPKVWKRYKCDWPEWFSVWRGPSPIVNRAQKHWKRPAWDDKWADGLSGPNGTLISRDYFPIQDHKFKLTNWWVRQTFRAKLFVGEFMNPWNKLTAEMAEALLSRSSKNWMPIGHMTGHDWNPLLRDCVRSDLSDICSMSQGFYRLREGKQGKTWILGSHNLTTPRALVYRPLGWDDLFLHYFLAVEIDDNSRGGGR